MNRRITPFLVGHTLELVADILARPGIPADLTISRFFAARRYLGSHDRGFISDATYALLREVVTLEWLLEPLLKSSDDRRGELFALAHMLRMGVEWGILAKVANVPFEELQRINDVLKTRGQEAAALEGAEALSFSHSIPLWLAERVREQYGAEAEPLLASLKTQAPIVLRVNRLAADPDTLIEALDHQGIMAARGRFSVDAVVLRKRMNAFTIPEFKRGWFELQDEGSQLLSIALDPHPNWRVFDACAGAGGKSLHLAAIMKGRGEVVAHDVNDRRLSELRPRLRRSGAQNIRVLDHAGYRERRESLVGEFHAVMIDAPCSGTGVLRRNPGVRLTLEESVIERLLPVQAEILDEYSRLVRAGGLLLYATCSLLREENESQVEGFLSRNPGWNRIPMPLPDELVSSDGYLYASPHRHGTDGFFGALFRRESGD